MNAAITILEQALHTLEDNDGINHREHRTSEQADLEAKSAIEIRQALDCLQVAQTPNGLADLQSFHQFVLEYGLLPHHSGWRIVNFHKQAEAVVMLCQRTLEEPPSTVRGTMEDHY